MTLILQDATVCATDGCPTRYDATSSGWDGRCDDCAARTADHEVGLHSTPQLDCPHCG